METSFIRYLLALAIIICSFVNADVEFTTPAAGADVPVGTIDVRWKESGTGTPIVELTQYTLALMAGGNEEDNMLQLVAFASQAYYTLGNSRNDTISDGIAPAMKNGFFFKITSTTDAGKIVINYSDRFSIMGLTGTIAPKYRNAATAAAEMGDTAGPDGTGDSSSLTSATTSSATTEPKSRASNTSKATVTVTSTASRLADISKQGHGGLSPGATAGVAVVAIVVALVGIAIAIWLLRRRKVRQRQNDNVKMMYLEHKAELSGDELGKLSSVTTTSETNASGVVAEAGDGQPPPEADNTNTRAELEGSSAYQELESPAISVERT